MQVEPIKQAHIKDIAQRLGGNGWKNSVEHWEQVLRAVEADDRVVLVARSGTDVCGYGSLLRCSAYPPFRAAGTPEIHDLATAKMFRGQGVARQLIVAFEQIAVEQGCSAIGLGVGLYADYGPAQRLYGSLDYVPDGRGVTYAGEAVTPGAMFPVDDELVLWLTKSLS